MPEPRESLIDLGTLAAPDGIEMTVVAAPHGRHVRLRAIAHQTGLATGRFATPNACVPLALSPTADDDEPQLLGFAFTQFALPVVAGRNLDFDFRPATNLHSPPALGLLLVRSADRTTLVAPLTNVHEQIVSVQDGRLRWGWHGDLDEVAAGFETTLGIYDGASPADVLAHWAAEVCDGEPAPRRRDTNPITSHLSYWTDNGAAYWYRTEAGRTIGATVAEVVTKLRADGVPIGAVELDSWFYPHETPRPITEIGYPADVPPTGMMRWAPRDDAFGEPSTVDAIERWADGLGRPPLVLHARHISPSSPYLAEGGEWWADGFAAQPVDPAFFRRWFDDAVRWGACCIEQDWMLMYWFGVPAMRAQPGRAAQWQRALDHHAGATGLGLLWCMATPADIVFAASLPNVVAVRTSDDYRFADDPALLWIWFLTVNRLAGALGLSAFKDVFFSQRPAPGADSIDGDPHAEFEALLSALSAGPVGIGDRIGHTDAEIVLRTCDADGRIRHVDRPVALIDDCLFGEPARGERLAWATATASAGGEVWTYVLAVNASMPATDLDDTLSLMDIGIDGMRSVLEWRRGTLHHLDRLTAPLAPRDWAFFVVAPPGRRADAGDLDKYVTVATDRP
jgi:hypothetical protein